MTKLIRPLENSIYNILDPKGIKFLTRLRLGFSHLREHKFRHNSRDTLNPMCVCSLEPENTPHYLLHCRNFDDSRRALMSDLTIIDPSITSLNDRNLADLLLFGDKKYNLITNQMILLATIKFIKDSSRFDCISYCVKLLAFQSRCINLWAFSCNFCHPHIIFFLSLSHF